MVPKMASSPTTFGSLKRELEYLYLRRSAVESLIRSLEDYHRSSAPPRLRNRLLAEGRVWAEKLAS